MLRRLIVAFTLAAVAIALGACGIKGPLKLLPAPPGAPPPPPASSNPALPPTAPKFPQPEPEEPAKEDKQ